MQSVMSEISHKGIVLSLVGNSAVVRIEQSSACSQCASASMCVAAEKKTKEIEATVIEPVAVGDEVEVTGTQRMQLTAVLLAYVLPFLILVGMMFVLSRFTQNEVVVGTLSLACLVPYLLLLKLLSPRLKRSLVFFVRPTR